MNISTKGALAAGAAGVMLLGGAGTFAFWTSESAPGVISASQQEMAALLVALGTVGYAVAILVAAFGVRRPGHTRS